jgi:hypothetical protein
MPTLVVETGSGSASANTFVSLEDAVAFADTLLFIDAWDALGADRQEVLLLEAARWLNRFTWRGAPSTTTQALAWPREDVTDRDHRPIARDTIPAFLIEAQVRLAVWLATQAASPFEGTGLQPQTELAVGPLRLTPAAGAEMPGDILALLAPVLAGAGGGRLVRV